MERTVWVPAGCVEREREYVRGGRGRRLLIVEASENTLKSSVASKRLVWGTIEAVETTM